MNEKPIESQDQSLDGSQDHDILALYHSLVENLPVSVARKDLAGHIIFANQAFCSMLGLNPAEIIGKTDFDLFPDDLASKYRHDDKLVQTTGQTFSDIEQNFSGGETHYFEVRKTPIRNTKGDIVGTQVIFWDVSAHKRVEAELDQERQLLNALLANTPDNIYFKDKEGRFIRISRAQARRLGLNHPADAVGKTDFDFFPEEQARKSREDEEELMRTGRSLESVEEQITWPDGTTTWVSTTKAPLRNFIGETIGTFGISRDITTRKATEQAQREAREAAEAANRAKGDFLAHMSHEIRTPMNAILGLTELALETSRNEVQRDYLETVLTSAESLLGVINQILDFSKIDANKVELEIVPFQLHEVVGDTVKTLEFRASEKGLRLNWSFADDVPNGVRGDPTRLRQVLVNLIANAIKFTDRGGVTVSVKSVEQDATHSVIEFSVADTGVGIPADKIDNIFVEFQQADSSTTRQYGGTGLGLAISAKLVELMGGQIAVESEPGRGSVFRFTARFELASAKELEELEKAQSELAELAEPLPGQPSLHVLLAEDGLANQKLVLGILDRMGHQADVANDGCEAVEMYSDHGEKYDLILMDVQMPDMDGLEAARKIRELEKSTGRHVPIIAVTAHAMEEDRQKCLEAGMDDYLRKPIRRTELQGVIRRLCGTTSPPADAGNSKLSRSHTEPSAEIWNQQEALKSVDGDVELLKSVAVAFSDESEELLEKLEQAAAISDFQTIRRLAHTFKGATRLFEAPSVQELAKEIELSAAEGRDADYEDLVSRLRNAIDDLKSALEGFFRDCETE